MRDLVLKLPPDLVDAFRGMPERIHNPLPKQRFDIMRSDVAAWLVETAAASPTFRQALFDVVHDARLIRFDSDSRAWGGAANGQHD